MRALNLLSEINKVNWLLPCKLLLSILHREITCKLYVYGCPCLPAVKPSKPRCWMEGKLLEGGDVKMNCKSADGSDPIHYKWERVLERGKYVGKLPPMALIGMSTHIHFFLRLSYIKTFSFEPAQTFKVQYRHSATAK